MADDKDLNASNFKDVVSLSEQLISNLREVAKIERHIQQSIGISSQEYLFNVKKLEEIVEKEHEISKIVDINKQLKQQIKGLEQTEIKNIQSQVKEQEEYKSSVEEILSQIRQELRDNKGLLKFAQEQVNEKSKELKFAQELVKNQESEVSKAEKLLQNKNNVTKETQNLISQKYVELQQAQELLKIQESELKQAQQTFSSFKEKVTEKQKEVSIGKELLKEAESEVSKTKEVLKSEKEKIEQLKETKISNQSIIDVLKEQKQEIKDSVFAGENQLKVYVDSKKEVQKIQEELNKQTGNIEKAKNLELNRKEINKTINELTSKKAELEKVNQKVVERINEIQTKELNTLTEHSIKKEQELDKQREIVEQSKFNLEYALRNTETTKDELDKLQLIKSEAEKKYSVLEKEVSKSNEVVEAKKQELVSLKETESITVKIVENIDKENSKLEQTSKYLVKNKNLLDSSEKLFTKISKVPLVGKLFDASKAMGSLKDKAKEGAIGVGDIFSALGKGLSGLTTATVVLAIFEAIYKVVQFIVGAMFAVDKANTRLAKNLSISKKEADGLRQSFNLTKNQLDTIYNTIENQIQAQEELSNLTKASILFSRDQIENQIILTKEIGLSAEEAAKLNETFSVFNENANEGRRLIYDQIAAFANQNKVLFNGKKILSEVSKVSGQVLASFKGSTKALVDAVMRTEKLGMNLEQAKKISEGLLDFESSIEAELEAELLTGKQLNLERARGLALQGDYAGVAEEIAAQTGDFYEFSKLNVLQQKALAQAVGMSADELADTLKRREFITKESQNYLNNLKDQAKVLRQSGEIDKANALERKAAAIEQGLLTGQSLESSERSVDAQEKFNQALERAKDLFANLFSGDGAERIANLINKLVGALEDFVNSIQKRGIMGTLFGGGMEKERATRLQEEAKKTQSELQGLQKNFANAQTAEAKAEIQKQMDEVASRSQQIQKDIQNTEKTSGQSYIEGVGKQAGAGIKGAGLAVKAGKAAAGMGLKGAGKIATKVGAEKVGASLAAKGAGIASKGLAKRIPVLGSLISLGFAAKDLMEGDTTGAALQTLSAGAGLLDLVVPGLGTASSIAIDLADASREKGAFNEASESVEDALIRPGQKPVKFGAGDIIVATKKIQDYTGKEVSKEAFDSNKLTVSQQDITNKKETLVDNTKQTSLFDNFISNLSKVVSSINNTITTQQDIVAKTDKLVTTQQETATKIDKSISSQQGITTKGEYIDNTKQTSLFENLISNLNKITSSISNTITTQQDIVAKTDKLVTNQQETTSKTAESASAQSDIVKYLKEFVSTQFNKDITDKLDKSVTSQQDVISKLDKSIIQQEKTTTVSNTTATNNMVSSQSGEEYINNTKQTSLFENLVSNLNTIISSINNIITTQQDFITKTDKLFTNQQEIINKVTESVSQLDIIKYLKEFISTQFTKDVTNKLDKSISTQQDIATKTDKSVTTQQDIASKSVTTQQDIASKLDKSTSTQQDIASKLDKSITSQQDIASKSVTTQQDIANKIEKSSELISSKTTSESVSVFPPVPGFIKEELIGKDKTTSAAGVVSKEENTKETSILSTIVSYLSQSISVLGGLFTKQQEFTEKIEKNISSQQEFTSKTITIYNSFDRMVSLMETMLGPIKPEEQIKPMAPPITGVGAASTNTTNNTTITSPGANKTTTEEIKGTSNVQVQIDKLTQSINEWVAESKRPKDITIENKVMLDYETLQLAFAKKAVKI